jgi:hypothetical protein
LDESEKTDELKWKIRNREQGSKCFLRKPKKGYGSFGRIVEMAIEKDYASSLSVFATAVP